jgi:hypothetical protein
MSYLLIIFAEYRYCVAVLVLLFLLYLVLFLFFVAYTFLREHFFKEYLFFN